MPPSSKRFNLELYDLGSYDHNFCLKPPLTLWLAILYLTRALLIPFLSGVSSMGGAGDASAVTSGFFGVEDFVSAALALVVVLVFFLRTPSASRLSRRIWSLGRVILAAAAVFDLAVSLFRFLQIAHSDVWRSELLLLACTADAFIVLYLFRSRRVRDVFNDFPAPP